MHCAVTFGPVPVEQTGRLEERTEEQPHWLPEILPDCISVVSKPKARSHNVKDSQRHKDAPSKFHQLVIAEARQCAPHPYVQAEETKDLGHKPEHGKQGMGPNVLRLWKIVAEGAGPPAKEEQRGHAAHGNHVGVLGHEEHGELHRTVDRKSTRLNSSHLA